MKIVLQADSLDPPDIDIYNPAVEKYSEVPDAYFAFPSIFKHYPPPPEGLFYSDGILNIQLAVSRDGIDFHRFRIPYLDFDCCIDTLHQMYMSLGMLIVDDFIYQYFMGYNGTHGNIASSNKYYCVKQRIDGFVSLYATNALGHLVTKQFLFEGNSLKLNYKTIGTGFLVVGLLDENGSQIPGFSLSDADTLQEDEIAGLASWQEKSYIGHLSGQRISLQINMKDSKLYALQFLNDSTISPPITHYVLDQNFPNPFSSSTKISFNIPKASHVTLIIYNILGQKVSILVNNNLREGEYSIDWNSSKFASGVYFYQIQTDTFVETKKMVLLQ